MGTTAANKCRYYANRNQFNRKPRGSVHRPTSYLVRYAVDDIPGEHERLYGLAFATGSVAEMVERHVCLEKNLSWTKRPMK